MTDYPAALQAFEPQHDFFVGIDSDGCAFDTMELKHKECFIPNIIRLYGLQSVSKYAREVAEFINLYSRWRGVNRFPGLALVHDMLAERPEVARRGVALEDMTALKEFVASGKPLGNPALADAVRETGNPDLRLALEWSEAVNRDIAEMVHGVSPFPGVRESLEKLAPVADMMVVSATPVEALTAEWKEHDLARFVALIAGQEIGPKKDTLARATEAGYERDHVLMIGDAPGDLKAARANDALFFPIVPLEEEASWDRLLSEGLDRFLAGSFAGEYEDSLVASFLDKLPSEPRWKR